MNMPDRFFASPAPRVSDRTVSFDRRKPRVYSNSPSCYFRILHRNGGFCVRNWNDRGKCAVYIRRGYDNLTRGRFCLRHFNFNTGWVGMYVITMRIEILSSEAVTYLFTGWDLNHKNYLIYFLKNTIKLIFKNNTLILKFDRKNRISLQWLKSSLHHCNPS